MTRTTARRVGQLLAAVVIVGGFGAAGVDASNAERGTPHPVTHATTGDFVCTDGLGTTLGGGTVTTKEHLIRDRVTGWVQFDADNGTTRKYQERYTVTFLGGSTTEGSIVVNGTPLYPDWLYIDGTAAFAPNGFLGSYTGTATDICAELGYPRPPAQ